MTGIDCGSDNLCLCRTYSEVVNCLRYTTTDITISVILMCGRMLFTNIELDIYLMTTDKLGQLDLRYLIPNMVIIQLIQQ